MAASASTAVSAFLSLASPPSSLVPKAHHLLSLRFPSNPSLALPLSLSLSLRDKSRPFLLQRVAISSDPEIDSGDFGADEEEEEDAADFSEDLKLFVGNLPFGCDSAQLAGIFENAGTVEMVEVIYDKMTGRSRGFGFVTMSTIGEARAAEQQFNGYMLDGRPLRVNLGPPPSRDNRPSKPFRSGGSFEAGSNRVFVGNLSWGVDNSALRTLFGKQGNVVDAKVVYDRETGRSRGFGFVTFNSVDEVNNAIESLDGTDLDGRAIRVSVAESRPMR